MGRFLEHLREEGKDRGFRLATSRRRQDDGVLACEQRFPGQLLNRAQLGPPYPAYDRCFVGGKPLAQR